MVHSGDRKIFESRPLNSKALEISPFILFYLVAYHGKSYWEKSVNVTYKYFLCVKTSLRIGFGLGLPDFHSV